MKYPLASTTWDEKELNAGWEVLQSGMCSMGKKVEQFEREFSDFVGSGNAVMVNSGSSANLLMVAALFFSSNNSIKRDDIVVVPAVSWPTTYYPLSQYGLKLRFVDIDRETLNYDLRALEEAIDEDVRAIMCVNLLGNPNSFDDIFRLIKDREIIVLEDNCESMGAKYHGRQTGTFGLMGSYSTFFSHHMSTMEGGMIVTDDKGLYHILLSIRAHGWTRNLPRENLVSGIKSDDPFEESFKFVLPGYNVRPLEIEAAIGMEQLRKLPDFISMRKKNSGIFRKLFENHPFVDIQKEIGESSWFGFAFVIKESAPITRKELVHIFKEHGIECRPIVAGNFTKNPVIKWMPHEISGELSNADLIDANGLFIGNHHYDLEDKLRNVLSVLDSIR